MFLQLSYRRYFWLLVALGSATVLILNAIADQEQEKETLATVDETATRPVLAGAPQALPG